jgi:hypothetical protein
MTQDITSALQEQFVSQGGYLVPAGRNGNRQQAESSLHHICGRGTGMEACAEEVIVANDFKTFSSAASRWGGSAS